MCRLNRAFVFFFVALACNLLRQNTEYGAVTEKESRILVVRVLMHLWLRVECEAESLSIHTTQSQNICCACTMHEWMHHVQRAPHVPPNFHFYWVFSFFFFLLMRTIRKQSTTMPQSDTHHTIKMQLNNIKDVNSERNQKSNKKSAIIWYEKKN